ncbi:MAG: hypothetical protein SFU98_15495 [Leptospiraceae bacterium]|nr:hypothetical protein [Leptospiraceae bacterium]
MRLLILTIILFLFNSCYMHHANVKDDYYGAKTIVPSFGGQFNSSLPIRVEFSKLEKSQAIAYLQRKGVNIEIEEGLVDSYNSDEILAKIRASKFFTSNLIPILNLESPLQLKKLKHQ